MTPEQLDRVFGCGRLQMVTGKHVEVFREASAPGTRRRYTKRFLHTLEADFGQWTEREWRILARLIGHGLACVPDVVQYDRGAPGGTRLVQTYDAGATVDQWATILPIMRNGGMLQHVFQDCAHWWALAHHCLLALQKIHELSVVHLDIKGDNVCVPIGPSGFDPQGADLHIFPRFTDLALIDFAFSLVSRESLTTALPIGWQTDYDYQSPRLLHALEAGRHGDLQPTRQLDWRCDMYSLAAMLKRYLPNDEVVYNPAQAGGWSVTHVQAAKKLILALREAHDGEATLRHPHERILELTAGRLAEADMAASLAAGWTLARDANVTPVAASPATPVTRLAPPLRVLVTPRVMIEPVEVPAVLRRRPPQPRAQHGRGRLRAAAVVLVLVIVGAIAIAAPGLDDPWKTFGEFGRTISNAASAAKERMQPRGGTPVAAARSEPVTPAPPDPALGARPGEAPSAQADAGEVAQVDAPRSSVDAGQVAPADAVASSADAGQVAQLDALPSSAPASEAAEKAAIDSAPVTVATAVARPQSRTGGKVGGMPSRPATIAKVPTRPPKLANAPSRAPAVTAAKIAPSTAAVTPPSKRVRFFDEQIPPNAVAATSVAPVPATAVSPPEITASAAVPPEQPVTESVVAATTAATTAGTTAGTTGATAPAAAIAPSQVAPAPAPRPKAAPPGESERRSILSLFTDVFRSSRGKAPIEDRATPSAGAPPAPAAQESPPTPRDVAPRVAPLGAPPVRDTTRGSEPDAPDLAARARRTLAESVPYAAAQAQGEIARVLRVAASAGHPAQEHYIVDAVRRAWPHYQIATSVPNISPSGARQLNEQARHAYVVQRNVAQAFDLQLRAFGANPRDAEVAGNLAFLYLSHSPMHAETARQLSLHAIALRSLQMREARVDDWSTLAIASALTRRQADATNAFYVAVALSSDLERSCRGALNAVDRHGDIMVAPVQAMMLRIRHHGRNAESPYCAWPLSSRAARVF